MPRPGHVEPGLLLAEAAAADGGAAARAAGGAGAWRVGVRGGAAAGSLGARGRRVERHQDGAELLLAGAQVLREQRVEAVRLEQLAQPPLEGGEEAGDLRAAAAAELVEKLEGGRAQARGDWARVAV